MSRFVEIRRHSYTKKGEGRGQGSHLSSDGVALARRLGDSIGPFARVVVSDVPRTMETALAMGFAVDEILPFPDVSDWDAVIGEMGWHVLWEVERPFAYLRELLPDRPRTRAMAEWYAGAWRRIGEAVGVGESALVLTHGLISEAGLVACLPDAQHEEWGPAFSHCEGARLTLGSGGFEDVTLTRIQSSFADDGSA